jgi:transcriptional regulator with XRE-family HTH domain
MRLEKDALIVMVGKKVREIRLSKGLTIERVAFDAGIEYKQLSRIELGKVNTSIYQIYIISKSLNVEMVDLVDVP